MQKQVQKRDGSVEPYKVEKVTRVVVAAGLAPDQAKLLSDQVTIWVHSVPESSITSLRIRDKVLELLTGFDENVADFFRWYQKTKDIPPRV